MSRDVPVIDPRTGKHLAGRRLVHVASKGDVFHWLTVLKVLRKRSANGGLRALVQCKCGNVKAVAVAKMRRGTTRSCGCLKSEEAARRGRARHGVATKNGLWIDGKPKLYGTWQHMLARCEDTEVNEYRWYGARGIKVCDEWHDMHAFIRDLETEIGPRPAEFYDNGWPRYTLDRIDNGGDYAPGNVRWATAKEQAENKRPRQGSPACFTSERTIDA